jgi:hypothetical protein
MGENFGGETCSKVPAAFVKFIGYKHKAILHNMHLNTNLM